MSMFLEELDVAHRSITGKNASKVMVVCQILLLRSIECISNPVLEGNRVFL
jgi:hypothetical protein